LLSGRIDYSTNPGVFFLGLNKNIDPTAFPAQRETTTLLPDKGNRKFTDNNWI
jgi:hypothetical protein